MSDSRWLDLTGAVNVRDLGGLPLTSGGTTRPGVLLRSDTLQELTAQDVRQLLDWGLRTVIDRQRPFIRSEAYLGPDRRRRTPDAFAGPWRRETDGPRRRAAAAQASSLHRR